MPGYFVFPPTVSHPFTTKEAAQFPIGLLSTIISSCKKLTSFVDTKGPLSEGYTSIDNAEKDRQKMEDAWEERQRRDAATRQKRLEQARATALQGEIEWVRSGGMLRDSQGHRDYVRTEEIRKELRLQAQEKIWIEQWEFYERRWRSLFSSTGPVAFLDIPWPMQVAPSSVDEINSQAITTFLLDPLRVRTNTTTQRDRVRASLLRWHPDKMSSIMGRVVEEDVQVVRDGVNAVFVILKQIQDNGTG
jgi:hypothetical protein